MQKPVIEFQDVSFTHQSKDQKKVILEHFNLKIYPQDKVIIYGRSGSGKTTLFSLLLGFNQPDKGKILINGQPLDCHRIWELRKQFAYVDQDSILGQGRVKKIIQEYLHFKVNRSRFPESWKKFKFFLRQFNLTPDILEKKVENVSGGERQRLALALALSLNRPILLLDEVTSSLDPNNKKVVTQTILKEKDKTLLVVTHDALWLKQPEVKIFNFEEKRWQLR